MGSNKTVTTKIKNTPRKQRAVKAIAGERYEEAAKLMIKELEEEYGVTKEQLKERLEELASNEELD